MKKAVKAIGITAALAVMIPLSAYAATGSGDGSSAAAGKAGSSLTEMKGKEARFNKKGFGFMGQEVLDLLKLDEKTLKSKLAAGQTLAQIAEAQGVSRDTLKKTLTDAFNKRLEEQKQKFSDRLDGMIDAKRQDFEGKDHAFKGFAKFDLTTVAKVLDMTDADLKKALASDKSLADIAKEKGVDVQKVIDAQVAALKASIQEAVKAGKLAQAEADKRLAETSKMVEKFVNDKGFHVGHEFGGPHGHR